MEKTQSKPIAERHGKGMVCVNQTRPRCVNQIGKTQSKTLAERHGNGMVCVNQTWPHCVNQIGKIQSKTLAARHGMCESTFTPTVKPTGMLLWRIVCSFFLIINPQHAPSHSVTLHAVVVYISAVSFLLHLFVRLIYLFKVHCVDIINELLQIPIDQFTFTHW
jgi:hypothetical protein